MLLSAVPDLHVELAAVPHGGVLIPGERVTLSATVRNEGAAVAVGNLRLDLYASGDNVLDRAVDAAVGTLTKSIRIAPGASVPVTIVVTVPPTAEAGQYRLIVDADPLNGIAESDETNNVAVSPAVTVAWEFGALPGRSGTTKLVLQDGDGTLVTLGVSGKGRGAVSEQGDVTVTGTDALSRVSITVKGGDGRVSLRNVTLGTVKSFSAPAGDLSGEFAADAVTAVTLGAIGGGHSLHVGTGAWTLAAGRISGLRLQSGGMITSIRAVEWLRGGGASEIVAPAVGTVTLTGDAKAGVAGDFEADLRLSGAPKGATLGGLKAAGRIDKGTWDVHGASGRWTAGAIGSDLAANIVGALTGITTAGDMAGAVAAASIGGVTIGGAMAEAWLLAGADFGSDVSPGGLGDAADTYGAGSIGGITVKGAISGATVLAGVDPFDGDFNDINDVAVGGKNSRIRSVRAAAIDADSRIDGGVLPASATIGGVRTATLSDPRFGQGKYALTSAGTTDAGGAVTLDVAGQPHTFVLKDESTLRPLAGVGVAVSVDAATLSFGVMTIVAPGRARPVEIVSLRGTGVAKSAARAMAATADPDSSTVLLSDMATKTTLDVLTDKLVEQTFYTVAESERDTVCSQVGAMASGFTSLVSIGIHALDNVAHGAVSDYIAKLPGASSEVMTPAEAKARIVTNRVTDITGTLLLAGMKGKLDPLGPYSTAIDLGADGVAWGVADMAEDLPGMGVRVTSILGMDVYSFVPIPPWQRAAASGLVNVAVPTAADAANGFLELISKSNPGESFVTPLDTGGTASLAVPLGDYRAVVHAAGFVADESDVTIVSGNNPLTMAVQEPPSAGIVIAPDTTLHTSESGAAASFAVVLSAAPAANVTIKLASSDASEIKVSKTSLTFTPSNWDTPQMVVVTGVNDAAVDGDVACLIVTSAASSADPAYAGLNPADIAVVNADNEASATPVITFNSFVIAERQEQWTGDPVWGHMEERFRLTGTATANGPVNTYLYTTRGAINGTFVMTGWTGTAGGNHYRAAGDPASTTFTFDVYTDWLGVSSDRPDFTETVDAIYWSADPYLIDSDAITIAFA